MYELVNTTDNCKLVGEYNTLGEAKEAKQMYEDENPTNYYTIYRVTRVAVA